MSKKITNMRSPSLPPFSPSAILFVYYWSFGEEKEEANDVHAIGDVFATGSVPVSVSRLFRFHLILSFLHVLFIGHQGRKG